MRYSTTALLRRTFITEALATVQAPPGTPAGKPRCVMTRTGHRHQLLLAAVTRLSVIFKEIVY